LAFFYVFSRFWSGLLFSKGWKNDFQRTKPAVHGTPLYTEQSRETKKTAFRRFWRASHVFLKHKLVGVT